MRIGYAEGELKGDWAVFGKIAGFFVYRVLPEDREDFHHDLLLKMVKVKAKYDVQGKTLTEAGLMWVGRYEEKTYWAKRVYQLFGINCSNCTKEQRRECSTEMQFGQCPKRSRLKVLRLNKILTNRNGGKPTELQELIPGKSLDIDAKLDARHMLQSLPKKLVKIGYKVYAGLPLEREEKKYLNNWQEVHTSPLVSGRDHLDERVMELLSKNPKGMARRDLCRRLQVSVRDLNFYLARLIEGRQVVEAPREKNLRGRSPTPLFLIAGAEIPEEKNIVAERDEHIRQAYFVEGWSINRIIRELHHDKRTIRRAIHGIKIERR